MTPDFESIIERRRDGVQQTPDEFKALAQGAATGTVPDYQLAAWLMAEFFKPLTLPETAWLTQAMAASGERLSLNTLPRPWVDKHSTGGVGDKTTLVLLPLLAACGLHMVKMSGPGLGITGGTVDKLASIPGFQVQLDIPQLLDQAREIGIGFTAQTPDLAPADKVLYGLRDVTATVDSIPLIVSSILSKKIAGGAETIVIDVKCGTGAFMHTLEKAYVLAQTLKAVGKDSGLKMSLTITDMDQPLGSAVGNALEVQEALRVLTQEENNLPTPTKRFRDLCLTLAAETLHAAGLTPSLQEGHAQATQALTTRNAANKAAEWIHTQGGPATLNQTLQALAKAPVTKTYNAEQPGWIAKLDAGTFGHASLDLGAGRHAKNDTIDPSVGFELHTLVGEKIEAGQPLFTVHAKTEDAAEAAIERVLTGIEISPNQVPERPVVLKTLA